MRETQREEETKSVSCEQPLTGCPTAAWSQLAFVMTNFHPANGLYVFLTQISFHLQYGSNFISFANCPHLQPSSACFRVRELLSENHSGTDALLPSS